jgi:hypothetical protein
VLLSVIRCRCEHPTELFSKASAGRSVARIQLRKSGYTAAGSRPGGDFVEILYSKTALVEMRLSPDGTEIAESRW